MQLHGNIECYSILLETQFFQQDFPGMWSAGYFYPFLSRVLASVVGGPTVLLPILPVTANRAKFDKNWIFFTGTKLQRY
jgi:hypothetical protein